MLKFNSITLLNIDFILYKYKIKHSDLILNLVVNFFKKTENFLFKNFFLKYNILNIINKKLKVSFFIKKKNKRIKLFGNKIYLKKKKFIKKKKVFFYTGNLKKFLTINKSFFGNKFDLVKKPVNIKDKLVFNRDNLNLNKKNLQDKPFMWKKFINKFFYKKNSIKYFESWLNFYENKSISDKKNLKFYNNEINYYKNILKKIKINNIFDGDKFKTSRVILEVYKNSLEFNKYKLLFYKNKIKLYKNKLNINKSFLRVYQNNLNYYTKKLELILEKKNIKYCYNKNDLILKKDKFFFNKRDINLINNKNNLELNQNKPFFDKKNTELISDEDNLELNQNNKKFNKPKLKVDNLIVEFTENRLKFYKDKLIFYKNSKNPNKNSIKFYEEKVNSYSNKLDLYKNSLKKNKNWNKNKFNSNNKKTFCTLNIKNTHIFKKKTIIYKNKHYVWNKVFFLLNKKKNILKFRNLILFFIINKIFFKEKTKIKNTSNFFFIKTQKYKYYFKIKTYLKKKKWKIWKLQNTLKKLCIFFRLKKQIKIKLFGVFYKKRKFLNNVKFQLIKRTFLNIKDYNNFFIWFFYKKNQTKNFYKNFKLLNINKKDINNYSLFYKNKIKLVNVDKPLIKKLRLTRQAHWHYNSKGNLNRYRYGKILLFAIKSTTKIIIKNLIITLFISFFYKILSWNQIKMCLKFHLFTINNKFKNFFYLSKGDIVETIIGLNIFKFLIFSKKFSKKNYNKTKKWSYIKYIQLKLTKLKKRKSIPAFIKKTQIGFQELSLNWVINYSVNIASLSSSPKELYGSSLDNFYETTLLKLNNWRYNV